MNRFRFACSTLFFSRLIACAETNLPPNAVATSAQSSIPSAIFVPGGEPDWNERLAFWTNKLAPTFRPPAIGTDLAVQLSGGNTQRGKVRSVAPDAITLDVSAVRITLRRSDISAESRRVLFAEDFAAAAAAPYIKEEKARHLALIRNRQEVEAETKRKTEMAQRIRDDAQTAARMAAEQAKRNKAIQKLFDPWDGSIPGVVRLAKYAMNDPGSFQHVQTTYQDDGAALTVRMVFRGRNAFNALVVNAITARVGMDGRPIEILSTEP